MESLQIEENKSESNSPIIVEKRSFFEQAKLNRPDDL